MRRETGMPASRGQQEQGQEADEFIHLRLCEDLLPICSLQGLVLEVIVHTLAGVGGAVEEREGGGAMGRFVVRGMGRRGGVVLPGPVISFPRAAVSTVRMLIC